MAVICMTPVSEGAVVASWTAAETPVIAVTKVETDDNGDGAEDIICFTGTCKSDQHIQLPSGLSTHYTRAASGNEVRDFEYPRNPMMIVGWDTDNDGKYPPFDSDDTSVPGHRHR